MKKLAGGPMHSRLYVKSGRSAEQILLTRIVILVVLVLTILAVFWFDRAGLRDQLDGDISFSDLVYFTAVTVTTVGYGDIIPVTDRARLIDGLLVTPLRLVIWLVFLGTAYELVLQRWLENRRMTRMQKDLDGHLLICGYGHSGHSASLEAVARGTPANQIVVIDRDSNRLKLAADEGHVGFLADATLEEDLESVSIHRARAVLVCLGRDDAAVLTVLTIRQLDPVVRIIACVAEGQNVKLIRQAGANAVVSPSMVGGYLMADSVKSSHISDYVSDLMCSGGRVRLLERKAGEREVGKRMRDIEPGLVVRVLRGDQTVGFWEGDTSVVQEGDTLLVIEMNEDAERAGQ
tara:strand:- start:30254 stop:31297 length:1044 start_codon:yes stop_codon:yes gene_type:complete